MSQIHSKLKPFIQPYDDNEYQLMLPFNYICPKYGIEVRIPELFIFDGASIPRLFWTTTGSPFSPQYMGPALIHDYLYTTAKEHYGSPVTREKADKIFEYALGLNNVSDYQKFKMYRSLRILGWIAWNKHRRYNGR